ETLQAGEYSRCSRFFPGVSFRQPLGMVGMIVMVARKTALFLMRLGLSGSLALPGPALGVQPSETLSAGYAVEANSNTAAEGHSARTSPQAPTPFNTSYASFVPAAFTSLL